MQPAIRQGRVGPASELRQQQHPVAVNQTDMAHAPCEVVGACLGVGVQAVWLRVPEGSARIAVVSLVGSPDAELVVNIALVLGDEDGAPVVIDMAPMTRRRWMVTPEIEDVAGRIRPEAIVRCGRVRDGRGRREHAQEGTEAKCAYRHDGKLSTVVTSRGRAVAALG